MEAGEKKLGEILAREEIRETLHRYCFAVDRGTLAEVMELFDDSCDLELMPGRKYSGRPAVQRWYAAYMGDRMEVLRHLIHNQVIEVRRNEASSRSYFDAVGVLKGESIVAAGFYYDQLRYSKGRWRFSEKLIKLDFLVPLHEGWAGKKFKRVLIGNID